ncbi:MAG: hypothetical protein DMF63_12360 [Acidobacteria bacterium]|nr:MAG: hypothetical protein DMF63_12360 [Acidobacteriota bacterium]
MEEVGKIDKLRSVTLAILDETRPAYSCRNDVLELKAIFEELSGRSTDSTLDISTGETRTDNGVAISPTMAAMCVDDFARTVQFLRGVHEAIVDKLSAGATEPVRVLYAGCGPWAPLAIPLMSLFSGDEVSFTLLDLHGESLRSVESIISSLDVGDRVEKLESVDASLFVIDPVRKPDLIVVEMLRAALESEPQIAVVTNLHAQAAAALLIPEKLTIELALVNRSNEFSPDEEVPERDRILVDTVLRFDRDTLGTGLVPAAVTIPDFDSSRYQPMLLTTVQVYGNHILRDYDSGITCPKKLHAPRSPQPGDKIEFTYQLGNSPRLIARITE